MSNIFKHCLSPVIYHTFSGRCNLVWKHHLFFNYQLPRGCGVPPRLLWLVYSTTELFHVCFASMWTSSFPSHWSFLPFTSFASHHPAILITIGVQPFFLLKISAATHSSISNPLFCKSCRHHIKRTVHKSSQWAP
jgi:hypothetical protein